MMAFRRLYQRRAGGRVLAAALASAALLSGCAEGVVQASFGTPPASGLPHPAHIVVVVEENHASGEVIGNPAAAYINSLAGSGASFTHSYARTHPSEPNYLALFSGSTHGLRTDRCPISYRSANLAGQLLAAHLSFRAYVDGLPRVGYRGCRAGHYTRLTAPWTDFPALPRATAQPLARFPAVFTRLPTLSFVTPDLVHDMHSASVARADAWLRSHIGPYVRWARTHDSLLVLTWDEDDRRHDNRIPTVIVGAHVRPGMYRERIGDYTVLRTLEALDRLPPIGHAVAAHPVSNIWTTART
jgi:acid phosphatase